MFAFKRDVEVCEDGGDVRDRVGDTLCVCQAESGRCIIDWL